MLDRLNNRFSEELLGVRYEVEVGGHKAVARIREMMPNKQGVAGS